MTDRLPDSSLPASPGTPPQPEPARCRTATRYGGAVDVEPAADLYTQGLTLRQIGAVGIHWSTVSGQLESAGITMRSGGPTLIPPPQSGSWSSVTKA
jgi:hypothetical protein